MINNVKIEWKIGEKYAIDDIEWQNIGTLEGFIVNQIPVGWKDQTSYSNRRDDTIYLVFKYKKRSKENYGYILGVPSIENYFPSAKCDSVAFSRIKVYGMEYGDSIDELLRKLQQNRVFTRTLGFEATYKEGYKEKY